MLGYHIWPLLWLEMMRDYVLLYVNGREHRISGDEVFQPASDFLRLNLMHCGTKVVCAEGDCGACSVMVGRLPAGADKVTAGTGKVSAGADKLHYVPLNSCIQYVYQLDCSHIITVEGLGCSAALSPVQSAMVDNHGAQCGYCTPGFVVAMSALAARVKCGAEKLTECSVKDSLTGNLCRCTGYESIIKAGMAIAVDDVKDFAVQYPEAEMIANFAGHGAKALHVKGSRQEVFNPLDLPAAAGYLAEHAHKNNRVVIVSGGTDVSVNLNKKGLKAEVLMNTAALTEPHLSKIELEEKDGRKQLVVGARVTLRELEYYVKDLLPEFHRILWVYGSPQIRHAGTLAGNIANGSPIADSLPFFMVMDGAVEVTGVGGSRLIKAADLYTGYKQLSMKKDELITRIFLPLPRQNEGEILKLYKVSRRQHLDISAFTAAFLFKLNGKERASTIASVRIFYGGVGPLVLRMNTLEDALVGKKFTLASFESAAELVADLIKPIDDVRGSGGYRMALAQNILSRVYFDIEAEQSKSEEAVCR